MRGRCETFPASATTILFTLHAEPDGGLRNALGAFGSAQTVATSIVAPSLLFEELEVRGREANRSVCHAAGSDADRRQLNEVSCTGIAMNDFRDARLFWRRNGRFALVFEP